MKTIEQLLPYIELQKYMFLQYAQSFEIAENGKTKTVQGSPNMYTLLNNYINWINENIIDYLRNLLNHTHNINDLDKFGVVVWSNILGFNPDIYVNQIPLHNNYFGVDGKGKNFDQSHFQSEFDSSLALSLTLEERVKMLQLRYLSVMWDGSMEMLNNGIKQIFKKEGKIVAIDNINMSIAYRFYFKPSAFKLSNLFNPDFADGFWPRPATVKVFFENFSVPYLAFDNKELAKFDDTKLVN
jgi:hypothetical protein